MCKRFLSIIRSLFLLVDMKMIRVYILSFTKQLVYAYNRSIDRSVEHMITIQEIANLAGVSRGTVDRVINHRGKVKAEIEKNIQAIMKEHGYVQKPRQRNFVVGVVTQLYNASFMKEIQKGLDKAKEEYEDRGIQLHMVHSDDVDEQKQLQLLNQLEEKGVDAIAIMPVDHPSIMNKINELVEKGIPVVCFNSDIAGTKRSCFVGMDNRKSGKVAAGLLGLLNKEEGKILIITGYFTNRANSMRIEGFMEEMQHSYPKMELLGVQCSYDKAELVEDIVHKAMKESDVSGIFLASAGQEGLHNAFVSLHDKKRPYVVAYDVTERNIERLKRNDFDFLIDQESLQQGYLAIKILYELLQKKKQPIKSEWYTNIQLKTKDSI